MADGIELRPAKISEAPLLAVMSRDLVEQGLGWSWTPSRIAGKIRHPESVVLAAILGNRPIGFAIMGFARQEAHLELLAVQPSQQRLGVGRRLVRWLEKSALTAGTPIIYLELRAANRAALLFYHKLGYRKVALARGYYQGRESAIRMGRDLWSSTSMDAS